MTEKDDEKKRELRKKIEYQVACEEKAFRIVERLIENPIAPGFLQDAVAFITPNHYIDVTEERAVSGLCGYPVCQNSLNNVPKQKYFISTKTNKVYDIETRKNFCCGKCYKASKHLEQQISTEPVWSRKNQSRKPPELLPLDMKIGRIGDEVTVSKRDEMKQEVKRLYGLDQYGEALKGQQRSSTQSAAISQDKDLTSNVEATNNDECVYTLDKALSEMEITDNHGDSNSVNDDENFAETVCSSVEASQQGSQQAMSPLSVDTSLANEIASGDGAHERTANPESCISGNTHHEHKVTDKPNKKNKASKQKKSSTQSKTEYLMQLLDKRKSLLAKMADIQPQDNVVSEMNTATGNKLCDDADKIDENNVIPVNSTRSDCGLQICDTDRPCAGQICDKTKTPIVHIQTVQTAEIPVKSAQDGDSGQTDGRPSGNVGKPPLTVVGLVCEAIRSWITRDSADYLKDIGAKDALSKPSISSEQYRALVAKVDAQETDFSHMIGEESMASEQDDGPTAPAPHFEFLREEAEKQKLRVHEFMKGSFTYKETDVVSTKKQVPSKVKLPTVDRYDQMLIRQKIVLDKISKVLPDILSPLHLLIQDIYTELKELVFTFNFTSENILFKPAEWTIVAIILLKLLSWKHTKLQEAFLHPGVDRFFNILLSGLGETMESLDGYVTLLLPEGHR